MVVSAVAVVLAVAVVEVVEVVDEEEVDAEVVATEGRACALPPDSEQRAARSGEAINCK